MKALLFQEVGKFPTLQTVEKPKPSQPGEVVVKLKAAALNRRDYFITQGLYPGIRTPMILGSDGAGLHNDRLVVINPALYWGPDLRVQQKSFEVLGMPTYGTMAEEIVISSDRVHSAPEHLTTEEAAAIPLAGLTAYRALFTRGKLQEGQKLLITGIGGGVSSIALQFANAVGAKIAVTSGSDQKLDQAKEYGAALGVNYFDEEWAAKLSAFGEFDLILDSAGGDGFSQLVKLAKPGGTISLYGGTRGKISNLSPQVIFWKQLDIKGSTMGSDKDFADMLSFVEAHKIRPVIHRIYSMEAVDEAFESMAVSRQFGKIVIRISE